MRTTLFRQEAIDAQRGTLLGGMLAAYRLPLRLITAFSLAAALAIVMFCTWGEYTRKVHVDGVLVTGASADAPLHATLEVPADAIDFVAPGSTIWLRYRSFPFQRYGSFRGRVTDITATAQAYTVHVAIESQVVHTPRADLALRAGMALDADLWLERRRISDWMFEPITGAAGRV
jgi:hypothetical protein